MEINTFLAIFKRRKNIVLFFVLAFILAAAAVTFSQPLKYRASSRLLMIQEGTNSDAYSVAKANQYLGSLLAESAYSGSFFDLLSSSNNQSIDWGYFSGSYKQQIKTWKKTIYARNVSDTGIIEIEIYHPNADQAKQISLAVDNMLMTQNNLYQNSNSNLKIKVIDQPIVSSFPVKPNLFINFGAALIFGFLLGLAYIYNFPVSRQEKKQDILAKHRISLDEYPRPAASPTQDQSHFVGNIKNIMN